MNILIMASSLVGHELEYIHHYYDYAINDNNNKYVFLIPDNFDKYKDRYEWHESENVSFDFVGGRDLYNISSIKGRFSHYLMMYHRCKFLSKKCKEYAIDRVLVNSFLDFFPFLYFFVKNIEFRGIVYKSPYKRNYSRSKGFLTYLSFKIISKTKLYNRVFLLNDEEGANWLNKKYNSLKFTCLPDPVPPIDSYHDIRQTLSIPTDKILFLQFGGLTYRKRTVDILNAIKIIEDKSRYVFVFAGKLGNCRDEYYRILNELGNSVNIITIDKFCDDDLLNSLCYSCDCVLVPYLNFDQSSGCLGRAAYFNKPVIGPEEGLLGRLIRDYKLGICLPSSACVKDISRSILEFDTKKIDGKDYVSTNSIKNFQQVFFND